MYTLPMFPVKAEPPSDRILGKEPVRSAGGAFSLAHLSDPHLFSVDGSNVRDFLNKRVFAYLNWTLNRRIGHGRELLKALVSDLQYTKPDHIVLTGDLTHMALASEFRMATQLFQSLGPPSRVTVIPGNHDAYVDTKWHRTFAQWMDYMASDTPSLCKAAKKGLSALFPTLRVRGRLAIIGVSTALPSRPLLAIGTIGPAQMQRLECILAETRRANLFRVLLLHHPPARGTVTWRKRLTDSAAFHSILARHGVELILHGHAHRTSFVRVQTASGKTPAIGVSSASALDRKPGRRASYHVYQVSENPQGWDVFFSIHRYCQTKGQFLRHKESHLVLQRQANLSPTTDNSLGKTRRCPSFRSSA